MAAHLHDKRLQEQIVLEAAQEASQPTTSHPTHARPIEAPTRHLHIPPDLLYLTDRLPATLEVIPAACLQRYLRIWTETLEGMVAGSEEWAMLGATFTKLLLTCFKKGEHITKEVEYRLWYLEEGRVDELASYMKQRLIDYKGDQTSRRDRDRRRRPDTPLQDPNTTDRKTAKQVITKARKNVSGKAIKAFTPGITQLTDQQTQDYVPIFLPGGATGRRTIT